MTAEQQTQVDEDLRIELDHNQQRVKTDRQTVVQLDQMPLTSLTVREYAEFQRI